MVILFFENDTFLEVELMNAKEFREMVLSNLQKLSSERAMYEDLDLETLRNIEKVMNADRLFEYKDKRLYRRVKELYKLLGENKAIETDDGIALKKAKYPKIIGVYVLGCKPEDFVFGRC